MPLFFLVAGFLFNYTKYSRDFCGFVKKKFKRLAVPYLVGSLVIFYPFWYFLGRHYGEAAVKHADPLTQFIGVFYATGIDYWMQFNLPPWFLNCMFVSLVVCWGIHRLAGGNDTKLVVLTLLASALGYGISFVVLLPWSIDIALAIQVFMLAGLYLRRFDFTSNWWWLAVLPLAAALALNGRIDTASRHYANIFLYYIGGIAGTILMMKISAAIDRLMSGSTFERFLTYCGRNSLMILMFQSMGFKVASVVFVFGLKQSLQVAHTYWPVYDCTALAFCCAVIWLKQKLDARMVRYAWWNRFFMW